MLGFISVNNRIIADVELIVRQQPVICDESTRSLIVTEGKSAKLECYAKGYPPPIIIWRRENNYLLPTGAIMYRYIEITCEE